MPKELSFESSCFMRLANGGHVQEYVNREHRITVKKIKDNRDKPWRMEITSHDLPGQIFTSMEDFRKAAQGV